MTETVEKIAEILNDMRIESKSSIQDIETALEKISAKIETSNDNEENYELIKVYISELKKIVEDRLSSNLSELNEENSQHIQESFDKQTLQLHTVFNNVNEVKDAIENLKIYFSQIDNVVKNSNSENIQLLSDKLQNIESLLTYNSDEYKERLQDLRDSLYEFAKTVENSSSQSETKIESSLNELSAIKNNLINLSDYLKSNEESNDEIASNIASIFNEKIGTVIDGMESINENLKAGITISLQEELSNIQQNFNEVITVITEIRDKNNDEISQNILDKISSLNDELILLNNDVAAITLNNREEILKALENFKVGITDFIDNGIVNTLAETKTQLETSFYAMSDNVNSKLTESSQSVNKLEQLYEQAFDKLDIIEDFVSDKIRNDIELLNNVFQSGVRNVKNAFKDELEEKYDALRASVDMVLNSNTVQDTIDGLKSEISAQINEIITNSQTASAKHDEIIKSISSLASNMRLFVVRISQLIIAKYNPEKTKEILESLKSDNVLMQEQLSQINTKIENSELTVIEDIGKINTKLDEIRIVPENLEILNAKVDAIASDTSSDEIISEIDNINEKLNGILSEKLGILDEKLESIKSDETNHEIIENISDLNSKISDFALISQDIGELNAKVDTLASDMTNIELADNINEMRLKLTDIIELTQSFTDLSSKIDILINENADVEILENVTSLNSRINDLMLISDEFNELNSKIDLLTADKSNIEIIQDISDMNAKLDEFTSIYDNISLINSKIDDLSSDASNLELIEDIKNITEKLDNISLLTDNVTALNSKLDTIISDNTKYEIIDDLETVNRKLDDIVSDTLNTINAKVDAIASDESSQNILYEIDDIKNIIFEQQKLVEASADERAAAIDKYLRDVLIKIDNVDIEKNAQDIKDTILTALLSLVDQISFVEETEEIKDFVEEKTDSINKTLVELKDKIRQLINPDDDGFSYVYTLQDVESDIAKLRLAVNNLQNRDFTDIIDEMRRILTSVSNLEKSLTHEEIEKIKEDLLSISTRTNKLLLNSEESSKMFTDNLNSFSNMVDENTRVVQTLDMKLDNIKSLAESSSQADKVFHQSLMYLGEWIDSTTENIAAISERVYQIPEIQANIRNIENSVPETSRVLNVLAEKYEEQNSKIEKLEKKLEQVLTKLEKNDNSKLDKKLDRIEKMISGLSGSIDKLTSYVDE